MRSKKSFFNTGEDYRLCERVKLCQTFQECVEKEDFMLMVSKMNLFHL